MPQERLSPLDASFLYLDGDVTCNQAVGLNFADGPIDFERAVDEMQRKIRYADRLRQCAVFSPFYLFRPTWEFDPKFDRIAHISDEAGSAASVVGGVCNQRRTGRTGCARGCAAPLRDRWDRVRKARRGDVRRRA